MRYQDLPQASAEIDIGAPPEAVWRWVSDIALMAELSQELRSVEWLDGVTVPAVGARFRGTSFHPARGEWTTVSTVTECEPGRRFTWTVNAAQDDHRPSSTWSFELTAIATGTRLKQTGLIGPARSGLCDAIDRMPAKEEKIVASRLDEFRTGLERNLTAIKERAEADRS